MDIIINKVNDLKAISIVYVSYNDTKKIMTKKTAHRRNRVIQLVHTYYTYTRYLQRSCCVFK